MFTGLIESVGTIRQVSRRGNYTVLTISSSIGADHMQDGESVSCDGACLTIVSHTSDSFIVEASQETTSRTLAGTYRSGAQTNLERALRADSRLGGHFVTGHVDCVGKVEYSKPIGESLELAVAFDHEYDPLVIEKGSIAINGVSLTINTVRTGWLSANLIPFTVKSTTLGRLRSGDAVNLEFDMLGKYVLKMQKSPTASGITIQKLQESGW